MTSNNQSELPEDDDDAAAVIVQRLKSQGIFDSIRRECLADIDTKPAFLNLSQRIERYVSNFLERQEWRQDLNKNQLRERLRRNLTESNMMKYGVDHLVDGAVQAKKRSFQPEVEKVVKDLLGIEEEEVEWSEESKEPDVDNSQQDMDVDSDDGPSVGESVLVKSESFIPSFVEVHSSSQSSSSPPPTKSIIQQLFDPIVKKEEIFVPKVSTPTKISIQFNLGSKQPSTGMADMDLETDEGSNQEQETDEGSNQEQRSASEQVQEEVDHGDDSRPSSKNSISDIQLPPSSPPPLILSQPKMDSSEAQRISPEEESDDDDDVMNIEAQYSPVNRSSTVAEEEETDFEPRVEVGSHTIRQSTGEEAQIKTGEKIPVTTEVIESEGVKSESVKSEGTKSAPKEDIAPVEYLSDVSSVHTSDLSDFDAESSSEEEESAKKAKVISGGKGKSKGELEERAPTDSRKRSVSTENVQQITDSRPSTASSSGRRERKVNPKYASDEYSSIYNRKKNQTIEEDISSDEDFEGESEPLATPLQDELSDDGSSNTSGRNAEEGEASKEEETLKAREKLKEEETPRAPKAGDSTPASESTISDGYDGSKSQLKNIRRKTSRRQERYDASDLYKPRPVIGTSRRNRSAANSDQPT